MVLCLKKQENGFAALYNPYHLTTRRHQEHKEKALLSLLLLKFFVGSVALCEFHLGGMGCGVRVRSHLVVNVATGSHSGPGGFLRRREIR